MSRRPALRPADSGYLTRPVDVAQGAHPSESTNCNTTLGVWATTFQPPPTNASKRNYLRDQALRPGHPERYQAHRRTVLKATRSWATSRGSVSSVTIRTSPGSAFVSVLTCDAEFGRVLTCYGARGHGLPIELLPKRFGVHSSGAVPFGGNPARSDDAYVPHRGVAARTSAAGLPRGVVELFEARHASRRAPPRPAARAVVRVSPEDEGPGRQPSHRHQTTCTEDSYGRDSRPPRVASGDEVIRLQAPHRRAVRPQGAHGYQGGVAGPSCTSVKGPEGYTATRAVQIHDKPSS